jgi:DNA-binding transcriptional LysR family regulator
MIGRLPERRNAAMDRIAAMTAFVRVVEAGTFTRAADTLGLPNATVTRLIQSLERELKIKLLQRTTRSVTVTPEGANYYERVVKLLADLADIESSAAQSLARPSGRVRVETAAAIASLVIVPALPAFRATYPDVELDFGIGNRQADLVAEGVDCAIRVGEATEPSLVARQVGSFSFVTCASPALLASAGRPHSPEDLAGAVETVGMASSQPGRPLPFRFAGPQGTFEVSAPHRIVVNDTNAYLAAGLAGLGIIQAPGYAVQASLESGALVPVLADWKTPRVPINVVYPPNRFLSAKVRVFIDWVIALFEAHEHLRRD